MEPGGSVPHSQGLLIIPILSRINPIPRIYTYFLRYFVILPSYLRLLLPKGLFPVGLPVKILKTLLPYSILAKLPEHLNLKDLITLTMLGATVQTMKSLIVLQRCSTTGNIIVLYILIFK